MIAALDYDIINNGLWAAVEKSLIKVPQFTFLTSYLFGLQPRATDGDFIELTSQEIGQPELPEQTKKYTDPLLTNYQSGFAGDFIYPQYYLHEEPVDLSDLTRRVSMNEPINAPWSYEQRAIYRLGEKIETKKEQFAVAKEKMCADLIFKGKYSTMDHGDQSSRVKKELKSIDASSSWATDPIDALTSAADKIFSVGGIVPNVLIMHPKDVPSLINNSKIQQILDNRRMELGSIRPGALNKENGASWIGYIVLPSIGTVEVWSYRGNYVEKRGSAPVDVIPRGSAYFGTSDIGKIGYCGLLAKKATARGNVQDKIAAEERYTVYTEDRGDLVKPILQAQTSPAAIITKPANFGIVTGIPEA